jgi:hypothetical protein
MVVTYCTFKLHELRRYGSVDAKNARDHPRHQKRSCWIVRSFSVKAGRVGD